MNLNWKSSLICLAFSCLWISSGSCSALGQEANEQPPAHETPVSLAAPEEERTLDRGDNAWMLTSSALVLAMTVPGLAMFYGGLVRKKNVVSVLMQCLFLMGMMSVIWGTYGYSLAFGGSQAWIGNGDFLLLNGVQAQWLEGTGSVIPLHPDLPIPMLTHMIFQGMFFIITPALICGAFAERMKFSSMAVFCALWGTLIYCPLCHWVWGGGVLAYGSEHAEKICAGGALDFAGGTVVHISSGVSALVAAILIGKRIGYGSEPMPPHNLTFTALGAGLLWVGWFGFNSGSALAADGIAASAFACTHLAAASGALGWTGVEWILRKKASLLGAASGAVAGLVCITPAAGFVQPMPAIIMGLAAGTVCFFTCSVVKHKLGYDDSLDAFGVHGVGGTLGALLTGVFATRAVWDIGEGKPLGLIEGGNVLVAQVIATLITWGFAIVGSVILLKGIDLFMGLRVSEVEEREGLDLTQHGEEGYIFA